MKNVLLTAVCFSVMALGALNGQAADDMPLPPPPPHHGDEMLPPPPPPGADKAMEKKMEKMEKRSCLSVFPVKEKESVSWFVTMDEGIFRKLFLRLKGREPD